MDYIKPIGTVDIMIMTVIDNEPYVMLAKRTEDPFKGKLAILGGFIFADKDNDLEDTVKRVLKNKVNVENIYFEQLETIGGSLRDPRGWSISISYFALLSWDKAKKIKPGNNVEDIKWVKLSDIKGVDLAFDHNDLIKKAVERIKQKINYSTMPIYLLPEYFTITELQNVYEIFLGKKLDKSGFRKKIKDIPFLYETEKTINKNHRPAKLYSCRRKDEYKIDFFRSNII